MKKLLTILLAFSISMAFGQKENTFNFVVETTEDQTDYKFVVDDADGFEVDWGDDSSDTYNGDVEPTHVYDEAGEQTIKVKGEASRIAFNVEGDGCKYAGLLKDILTPVSEGVNGITSAKYMFRETTVESFTCEDFFDEASVNVIDMSYMFYDTFFNQDISDWDVSSVTDMSSMFYSTPFDQDISDWNVSNVTAMWGMFENSPFNQDIGSWDVSNVNYMGFMFCGALFDQDISDWNVSNVMNMDEMFSYSNFNQDIGSWDVSNVSSMGSMFMKSNFNQDISDWDVSNVTNMWQMFYRTSFNQDIGSWDVSNVAYMSGMFYSTPFDQDISDWDVSNVTDMGSRGRWEVGMFQNCDFNQDISSWDVSKVEDFKDFLSGAELSTEYYNKLLIKWSHLDLQEDIDFHGGDSNYDLGLPEDRRQYIQDEFGWTITDGGDTGNEVLSLIVYAEPKGAGVVEGAGFYDENDEITVGAIAEEGYEFVNWTGDTDHIDDTDSDTATVTMPAEDVNLIANFEDDVEDDVTSIKELTEADIKVFPNPAHNEFTVELSERIEHIRLIDMNGNVIKDKFVEALSYKLSVRALQTGMYFIQIHTDSSVVTEKVQIVR